MNETSETPIARSSTATAPAPAAAPHRAPRVFQLAAWVAIVAGTVFIVAVIFFTGFILGRHAGHHGGCHHHKHHAMMHNHGAGGPGGPGASTAPGSPSMRPSMGPGYLPPSVFRSAATSHGALAQTPTVIVLKG